MNQNNYYSKEQISKMRKDAINRANHMYQRSKNQRNNFNGSNNKTSKKHTKSNTYHNENINQKNDNQKNSTDFDLSNISIDKILDKIGIDKETALIIALIIILSKEKADYKLILSLVYLLI